ncbi:M20/M25/M40 family metallo-hydrolase [Galbitalea sp. SE-J8]|uniref:M20/M25/M40 family metallo-hydrolase n=1 Tax=Galbitalea sp. SE-J8 TaxID=3054952 RepID=UPI00259C938F|nr:M20/M25/M40 family metallo-hydrolase [Galbitalea sp. SE-J8]MDM4763176.1 M20/M25/M40 family metallo-hydrolase [Galbitalea sp. SE-J8]
MPADLAGEGADGPLEATARIARDLIRFDTTNWGEGRANGETEAAEYLGGLLARLGATPEYVDAAPTRTSVVARFPGRDRDKPALVLHGHTDVVPADPANWSVDPFEGVVRDGLLWGRGAVDMKDMDAMIVTALQDVIGAGERPARDLVVAFFSDEENGGVYGSQHLVRERPDLFAGATEAISEVGGWSATVGGRRAYLLQTGEKALLWVRLRARGTASHGSRLMRDNAVTKLAEAVARIGRQEWPVRLTDTTRALVTELARLLGVDPEVVGADDVVLRTGSPAGFIQATLRTTTNPTMLTAGYKHNVIPDSAEARVDIRPLPGEEDAVLAQVRELAGPDIEVEVMEHGIGLDTPFEGALVDEMIARLRAHDPGAEVLPYLMSGGTDNKYLSKLGITGYGFAPLQLPPDLDFPGMFHGVDERVPLDALTFGRRVLADLIREY